MGNGKSRYRPNRNLLLRAAERDRPSGAPWTQRTQAPNTSAAPGSGKAPQDKKPQ